MARGETKRNVKPCPGGCGRTIDKRAKSCAYCAGVNLPEQRDQHALCGALRTNGERCRQYAGARTDHRGHGPCWLHAGNTPAAKKSAVVADARTQLAALGEPLPEDTRPTHMLLWLSRVVGGHVQTLLADPESADFSTEVGRAKFRLTMEQIDRAARLAKQCSEANAEQAEATFNEAQAALMASMVKEALELVMFSDADIKAVGVAMRVLSLRGHGDHAAAARAQAELDQLREQLIAADAERIAREAQRLTGLVPAEEIAPREDTGWMNPPDSEQEEVVTVPPATSPPPVERRPVGPPDKHRYRSDLPSGDDRLGSF